MTVSHHVDNWQMKESLNMHGSELTYAGNCFTAGYVLGQMPAVMLATRVRPSILIPTLEILWSVLTFCTSSVTNVSQLYAIRFLIGLCESGYFPVMIVSHIYLLPNEFCHTEPLLVSYRQLVHKGRTRQARRFVLLYCSPGRHV
jgi:MFS family permease